MNRQLLKERLRPLGGAVAALMLAGAVTCLPAQAATNGRTAHSEAVAALHDTRLAIAALQHAADITASDPTPYKAATHAAINALVGRDNTLYKAVKGDGSDRAGALGHLNWLLHRPGNQPWNAAVHGAWVNDTVAVDRLRKALAKTGLDEYQLAMTDALESLEVAVGRDSTTGALGGLEGALATTSLAVPDGARTVPGCDMPVSAPSYGVRNGYLIYVALPGKGVAHLPQYLGVRDVSMHKGMVVLKTAAAADAGKLCPATARKVADVTRADPPPDAPRLYTLAQAKAGKAVYASQCASCHGGHLQGGSAPPNAGAKFLHKAKALSWSVSDMRYLVVNSMPLNNPSSLSAKQYAQVLAFLLASDCYPAGKTPFPTKDTAKLKHTKLTPVKGVKADNPKLGTCNLQE